jgi:hypothetical protein
MNSNVRTNVLCFLALMALAPAAVYAAGSFYQTEMLPSLVVPACNQEGVYGTATLIVYDDSSQGAYTLNFGGLVGAQTGANLMAAAVGANGPVLLSLPLGTPIAGLITVTSELRTALTAGNLAVQINSDDCPGGVLRGNFAFVQVATDATTWSSVKALFE